MKRHIAILFLICAHIIILAHIIIPHHHHGGAFVPIVYDSGIGAPICFHNTYDNCHQATCQHSDHSNNSHHSKNSQSDQPDDCVLDIIYQPSKLHFNSFDYIDISCIVLSYLSSIEDYTYKISIYDVYVEPRYRSPHIIIYPLRGPPVC